MDSSPLKTQQKAYLYRTTVEDPSSSINGHFYIGVHLGDDPENDGYFGSGVIITNYIRSKGRSLLRKEVLHLGLTPSEAYAKEASIVDAELLGDPLCLNRQTGGCGYGSIEASFRAPTPKPLLGRKVYNDGQRRFYLHEGDPLIETLNLKPGALPFKEHQKELLRKSRKPFVRTESHKAAIAATKAKTSKMSKRVKTPWGIFENYASAWAAFVPEHHTGVKFKTKQSLVIACTNPDTTAGLGSRKKSNPKTYGEMGFGLVDKPFHG